MSSGGSDAVWKLGSKKRSLGLTLIIVIQSSAVAGFARRVLPRGFHGWFWSGEFGQRKTRYPVGIAG